MPNLDTNYINKFKLPHLSTCVIVDGIYQPELSNEYEEGITFNQQTIKVSANAKIKKPIHLLFFVFYVIIAIYIFIYTAVKFFFSILKIQYK